MSPQPVTRHNNEEKIARLYFREVGETSLLSMAEEQELFQKMGKGDKKARDEIIKANLRLVISIARQYRRRGLLILDLIEEGNSGLLKAVERFDYTLGYRFSTYATWWIRQAIERGLANQARLVRIPAHIRALIARCNRATEGLNQEFGREPTDEEVAGVLSVPVEMVRWLKTLQAGQFSLDEPVSWDREILFREVIADQCQEDPQETASQLSLQSAVLEALGNLPYRERLILVLRFGFDNGIPRTLQEISHQLGITRERVRQIQNDALRRLRRSMTLIGWGLDLKRGGV